MRVRVGSLYTWRPVLMDQYFRNQNLPPIKEGMILRVINLPGCPRANTMGHCYVEGSESKQFFGLVCCNSLVPLHEDTKRMLNNSRWRRGGHSQC